MFPLLTLFVLAGAGCFLGLQVFWAWRLARSYPPRPTPKLSDERLPRVAVLLPLRGADPSLSRCLEGLLSQDYPDYEVRIIIDHPDDPAWEVVRTVVGIGRPAAGTSPQAGLRSGAEARCGAVKVQVSPLEARRETCSLKLSSLLQAIADLDEARQAVVLIDADVVPGPTWLRDLVTPLTDPAVGAASGVRWYVPTDANWGTLVRAIWNAAAFTQNHAFSVPWGGSLAIRRDVLRDTDILDRWAHSFCEDTGSYQALRDLGLRLVHVPAATMVNTESIDLKGCRAFIRRQMLTTRLYHPNWPWILTCCLGSVMFLAAAVLLAGITFLVGEWAQAASLAGIVLLYLAGLGSAQCWIDRHVHRLVRDRGETPLAASWKQLPAAVLTQLVHLCCLTGACRRRSIKWRGITYEFLSRSQLRLVAYHPYQASTTVPEATVSII